MNNVLDKNVAQTENGIRYGHSTQIQEHRGLLTIRYPMEHGVIRDWNDMERIWQYIYSKDQLQTFSEEVGKRCAISEVQT